MGNTALLNNVDHQDLRIITTRSAALDDNVMFAVSFPAEFRSLQAHYPIVFRKTADATGFQPIALFGFQSGQNLFLDSKGWSASYIPLAVERQPFLIGISGEERLIHIDMDSPRISTVEGERLFRTHGGTTDFLDRISSILLAIDQGLAETPAFIAALLEHELLESFVFDIELVDGSQNRLAGFYTINEERLQALAGAQLEALNRRGYLQAVFMAIASLSNLRLLVERQNRQLQERGDS